MLAQFIRQSKKKASEISA